VLKSKEQSSSVVVSSSQSSSQRVLSKTNRVCGSTNDRMIVMTPQENSQYNYQAKNDQLLKVER